MRFHSERRGQTPLSQTVDTREVVGKRVVSIDGASLGRVKEIRLHPHELRVEGLVVATELYAPDVYVDRLHIRSLRKDAATVVVVPSELAVGKPVVDADGWCVGRICSVHRDMEIGVVEAVMIDSERGCFEVDVRSLLSCQDCCLIKEKPAL